MTVVSVQDMVKRIRLLRDTMDTIYEISNLVKKSSKTNADTLAQLFSCEFAKFLRTPFLTEHFWWLLLNVAKHVPED